jgi:hypothetical protein
MARINAVMSVSWRPMATNARLSVGFLDFGTGTTKALGIGRASVYRVL